MSLYFWVILLSFIGPFILSFDKKVAYYKSFKPLIYSTLIVGIPFILWDIYFTENQIWGFNPDYLSGLFLYNLPIEECLFFVVIPFCCVFIHQVLKAYFPNFQPKKFTHFFAFTFTLSGFIFGLSFFENWYTVSACLLTSFLTIKLYFIDRKPWFQNFALTYIVAIIPFIIVNGILTGSITPEPIVWYSENHIIGPRIFTIPMEDLYYNYSLLLPIIGFFEFFKNKTKNFK
jgi:lycopene cyclase domain-containing protein